MILNLDPDFKPFGEGIQFKKFTFPGGEPHVQDLPELHQFTDKYSGEIRITHRINSFNDLGFLCVTVDALKRLPCWKYSKENILYLPLMPGARQDRVTTPGTPLTVKVYADIINSLDFNKVIIFDPHSDVTPALLNNCTVIDNTWLVQNALDWIYFDQYPVGEAPLHFHLISPDAGAYKKIVKLSEKKEINRGKEMSIVLCSKTRNTATGELSGFKVYSDDLRGKDCIIVDDIIDGGGTFVEIAKVLKEKNAGNLYLIVSHGIFSKGYGHLSDFNKIFTTDSFKTLPSKEQYSDIRRTFGPIWVPDNVIQFKLSR